MKSAHRTQTLVIIILNSRPRTRELLPPRKFPKVVSSESTAQFSTKGRCGKLSKNFYLSSHQLPPHPPYQRAYLTQKSRIFFDFWVIKLNLYILFGSSTICKLAGNVAVWYCLHLHARFSKGILGEHNCRVSSQTFRYPPSSYLHFFAVAEGSKNHLWICYLNCMCFCLCVCDMDILMMDARKDFS